jgi:AraC family transcriptional regulator
MEHYRNAGRRIAAIGQATILASSAGRGWRDMEAEFLRIPRGLTHVPGESSHRLGIHFGKPVNADCRVDGRRLRRVQKHGDIDIVPAGLDGTWEDDADCSILRLRLAPALLRRAAVDLEQDPDKLALTPAFQLRDSRIEAIAWAIKADLEADTPADPLYAQALGLALAFRLLEVANDRVGIKSNSAALSPRQQRRLTDFIEANLDRPLSLTDLAEVAGVGLSQLKLLFRGSFGMPVHQYVVRRRVEYARALLLAGEMPIGQIALAAGFAHQSHMTTWMRRLLGVTPGEIIRQA